MKYVKGWFVLLYIKMVNCRIGEVVDEILTYCMNHLIFENESTGKSATVEKQFGEEFCKSVIEAV